MEIVLHPAQCSSMTFLRRPTPALFRLFAAAGRRSRLDDTTQQQMKLKWLDSLSFPSADNICRNGGGSSGWVIGVDPDLSGAMAVLKPDDSAEVFDSPHLKVPVGKGGVRKRLDVKSMIELVRGMNAPASGTSVYIEQSSPFPKDGKQGWWSGGFGYGLWIGIMAASGYSVIPVPPFMWKNELKLGVSKDDSREMASLLFPSLAGMLKRKKDHGRAEALLIASYGKALLKPHDRHC
ncbi:hypothetical protein M569_05687 [Genlisea aurea]|uniref:Uncharacterized protein n=1 Tax=Genlisea aurea TaxID=192259 RepID=S8CPH2_9LAMI|nr:hypothetical protein M569_05687 [Genlisea aurea]